LIRNVLAPRERALASRDSPQFLPSPGDILDTVCKRPSCEGRSEALRAIRLSVCVCHPRCQARAGVSNANPADVFGNVRPRMFPEHSVERLLDGRQSGIERAENFGDILDTPEGTDGGKWEGRVSGAGYGDRTRLTMFLQIGDGARLLVQAIDPERRSGSTTVHRRSPRSAGFSRRHGDILDTRFYADESSSASDSASIATRS
jgi:hypothetical protein